MIPALFAMLLSSCGGTVETGPYAQVLNLRAGLTLNSYGQIVVNTSYDFPVIPLPGLGAIGWTVAYEKVLYCKLSGYQD